ncbi:hypothetical protein Bbelb_069220 [Branchiostoma belcheri]|nr:hypothetical protein Bbelb_069220 [Branchiostoma belcheri]
MAPRSTSDVGKLFVFVLVMVTTSDGRAINSGSLCQLRKSCTLLERMKDQNLNLDSKQRICHLATQALLIPADDDCEKPAAHAVGTIKPPETLPETLCQLRENCALMALSVPPQDPHYETMRGVCRLAHKKMDVIGNITCQSQRPELSREYYFDDCSEIYAAQAMFGSVSSGVYNIKPSGSDSFSVYCDMTTDGGGWTVIQNRFDGTLHFNRRFNDYKYGFGSASGEYGITAQNSYELYVELVDWSDNVRYAKYSSFGVGAGDYYQLSLGSYSGNAGDSLGYSNGAKFSARDRDQDASSYSCATYYSYAGGWWYKYCAYSALNGPYLRPSDRTEYSGVGIYWEHILPSTYNYYLKKSKMMIRPTDFRTGK